MWKRTKNTGQTRPCFSIVHQYIQRFNEVSGNKPAAVKKRSKTPGVMITQYVVNLPEGKITPDFQCIPVPVTINEGKTAIFKAVVTGDPKPDVSWRRTKGTLSDKEKFQRKYEDSTGEYILEIHKVTHEETDTYKCYAVNEYGKAVCTTTLNVIDASTNPTDFRKLLKKSKAEKADGENDVRFWDAMLNADRRDYESICSQYGVADLQLVLKKLEERKKERKQNLLKDGVIPYDDDLTDKYSIKSVGKTKDNISVNDLWQKNDTGLLGHIEEVNHHNSQLNETHSDEEQMFTEFKLSNVDFVVKIQEVVVQEKDSALFECVLTHPLPKVTWMRKGAVLENGEKYSITVSDHKLIHGLLIKDCTNMDRAIYSAVAGITSCSAWLLVEDESNPASDGKTTLRKTTLANGSKTDLEKVARDQQIRDQKEMEKILETVKGKHTTGQPRGERTFTNGENPNGTDKKANTQNKNSREDGKAFESDDSRCVTKAGERLAADDPNDKKWSHGQAHLEKETEGQPVEENEDFTGSGVYSKYRKRCLKLEHQVTECGDESVNVNHQNLIICQPDIIESSGNKNFKESVMSKKEIMKVQLNDHDSDAIEGKPCGKNDDFSKSGIHSKCIKQNLKSEQELTECGDESVNVNHQNLIICQPDIIESSGNKNFKDSVRSKKETMKVQLNGHDSDAIEGKPCGKNDDFSKSGIHSKCIKQNLKSEQELTECGDESVNVNRQNLTMCQLEVDKSSGNKKVKESVRSEKEKKRVQWNDHDSESGDKHVDVDQNQISNMSQHKSSYGSSGNEMLETMVTNENKTEVFQESVAGLNEQAGDNEEDEPSGKRKHRGNSKQCLKSKDEDGSVIPGDHCEYDQTEDVSDSTNTRHKRQSPLTEDSLSGVQFIWGLSDVGAIINETAEVTCKLSCEDCPGVWFRDGKKISPDDNFNIIKDGPIHKLVIRKCDELHSGKYRFEADGRKTEAMITVKDPPRFDHEHLHVFTEPMTVKVGQSAVFKLQFVGRPPIKIQWHRKGEELQDESNTKIETSAGHSRLLLSRCQRKDTGEIRIKLKNEHGFAEAVSHLIVLDKPSSPLGPAEVTESSANSIEFKWRAPKDDGGSPVSQYILERQQVGRNTWKKIGETPGVPSYRDTDVERGRKYCYRIQAVTSEGTSDVMETDEMQAGKFALPGPPLPPKVVSAFSDCITLSWAPPSNTGGSRILGYVLEKRKRGSNLWTVVYTVDPIKERTYSVRDVVEGIEYEFRVSAINLSGTGEFSNASEFEFARDPKKPPGKVTGLKVTETSYTNIILTWIKPEEKPGFQDEAKGYFVEIRQTDCIEWYRCNSTSIVTTSFNVRGLKSMDMYWVRVIATNDGGESPPEELPKYVVAMPSAVRPKFTKNKMKSFMVVRAGNSVRITVNFEASPQPEIMWLKDNVPVSKRVTISNSDGSTQLLIPCSEHSDSGIYSVLVKNVAGQETFNTDVRVTDDPKPPGAVALEEIVPGTVTVIWEPSPDEKRDDRLHYTVSKLDSTKHTWTMVADRLFNNRFTICNLMHGREYHFRVYAKNDIGISEPSLSPTWGIEKKKEKLVSREPTSKHCDLQCAPSFMVPLKLHTAPKGYECHMSCAVKGNPTPRITWYRNHISINTDANYYIYNTIGVCSMRILCVGPKDSGEYTVVAENSLGRAECSTVLRVRE